MKNAMTWGCLLSTNRLGCPKQGAGKKQRTEARTDFQRDFDRLVFSSAFRRLHGKTQVFPLPESDATHTRMTHSLESSCVGRSLGKIIGLKIGPSAGVEPDDIAATVGAACLAHDIGNPPFGHAGEAAFQDFFTHPDRGRRFLRDLSVHQRSDFTRFEGNALGFRILTANRPCLTTVQGGLGLTYATLGAFSKYPCAATLKAKPNAKASEKKFGFFHAEKAIFAEVAGELGLRPKSSGSAWCRHPLAFLTEAADDICYKVIDLEDGYKLRLVGQAEVGVRQNSSFMPPATGYRCARRAG